MTTGSPLGVAAVALLGMAAAAQSAPAAVLTILDVEGFNTPQYSNLTALTNMAGLTYDNVAMKPVGTEAVFGGHQAYGDNRTSVFDFGENWASLRIVETWSHTRSSAPVAGNTPTGFAQLWWDSAATGGTFDAGAGDVAETTLNFFLNTTTGQDNTWFRDVGLTEATAVTPQGRYLKVVTATNFQNTGVFSEIAVVGYVIPEPASLALIALGAAALLPRRR